MLKPGPNMRPANSRICPRDRRKGEAHPAPAARNLGFSGRSRFVRSSARANGPTIYLRPKKAIVKYPVPIDRFALGISSLGESAERRSRRVFCGARKTGGGLAGKLTYANTIGPASRHIGPRRPLLSSAFRRKGPVVILSAPQFDRIDPRHWIAFRPRLYAGIPVLSVSSPG